MTYAENLREGQDSRGSAFLAYVAQRSRFPEHLFVFVEERDDIRFYRHFTPNSIPAVFLPAGSKSQVKSIFRRLENSQGLEKNTAFIVDRDLDELELSDDLELLRTKFYSWESHAVHPEVIERILSAYSLPSCTNAEIEEAKRYLNASIIAFSELLLKQSVGIVLSIEMGGGFGFADAPVTQGAVPTAGALEPSDHPKVWLTAKFEELKVAGANVNRNDDIKADLGSVIVRYAHGKTFFRVFRRVVDYLMRHWTQAPLLDMGSPVLVTSLMPSDWPEIEYVREYLRLRRGTSQ